VKIKQHLLNNQGGNGEIKGEIEKYLRQMKNENTRYQNLWDATKAVLRGKVIVVNAYIKIKERSGYLDDC